MTKVTPQYATAGVASLWGKLYHFFAKRSRDALRLYGWGFFFVTLIVLLTAGRTSAYVLPPQFERIQILQNLNEPAGLAFAPDGRMFISERITGKLLIAKLNPSTGEWELNPQPFYTFDTPKDANGNPASRRSGGLRHIAFDPDFANNGFLYAYYMKNGVLHNRVVKLKARTDNPDRADLAFGNGGEQLLLSLPFNNSFSSGSHNGGALIFGADGKLYITTGDGWEGTFAGDPVQSLSTYTGKVFRINRDGTIPSDNPFYGNTTGSYRAIYALGLRNPYSVSRHPTTGQIYINEARGTNKADIYELAPAANFGHEGSGIGNRTLPWANASTAGGELNTGGAWYPLTGGPFPSQYAGVYFVALWGGNNESVGQINYIRSNSNTSAFTFETDIGTIDSNNQAVKPVTPQIGPNGNLYYLLTTYETQNGAVYMVRYTGQATVAQPQFTPNGGSHIDSVQVTITSATAGATIYYTLDGSEPNLTSSVYTGPLALVETRTIKAKAFKSGMNPSATTSALFTINAAPNEPPIADAGADKSVLVGQYVTLDGSGSTDPDGDDNLLTNERWVQLSGPPVTILDSTEEIAAFVPSVVGTYVFRLSISDQEDTDTDEVTITVVDTLSASIATAENHVLLTWPKITGPIYYEVHRSATPFFTPNTTTLIVTLPSATSSYTDSGAAAGSARFFYQIRVVDGANQLLGSSQEVGIMTYTLNNTGGHYTMLTIPFAETGMTDAAGLAAAIGHVDTVLKWNPATQAFRLFNPPATGDNFALTVGDVVFVAVKSTAPEQAQFMGNVVATNLGPLTSAGYHFLMVPFQRNDLTSASAVAADIATATTVLQWNAANQTFRLFIPPSTGDNFGTELGTPVIVLLTAGGQTE